MSAHEPRRMRAREDDGLDATLLARLKRPVVPNAQVDRTLGQPRDHRESRLEVSLAAGKHRSGIRRQRVGVDGRHEDRSGRGIGWRHAAERARPECRPEPGRLQHLADAVGGERLDAAVSEVGDGFGILGGRIELDHHRQQRSPLAAVDRSHGTGPRRRVRDCGVPLVDEERISERHLVAFPHHHPGLEAGIVPPEQRN